MDTYEQVKNPKSDRYIYIHSATYQNLLKEGVSEETLLSQPTKTTTKKPKSPKVLRSVNEARACFLPKQTVFSHLPNEIVRNELLQYMDLPTLMHFCQTNQQYRHVCNDETLWRQVYEEYFGYSQMEKWKTGNWYDLVKLCYQLQYLVRYFDVEMSIKGLYELEELDLTNKIAEVPKEIGILVNLRILTLSDNLLTQLPPDIGKLVNLTELYLQNNKLYTLPVEIGKLISLQYLNLRLNQLSTLPTEIGQLINLEYLYLTYNQLTTIPTEMNQLIHLKSFWLHRNPLTKQTITFLKKTFPKRVLQL